jgi:hypothetical protein
MRKSRIGAFTCVLILGFLVSVYLSHKVYAQSANLVLYDNFDGTFLSSVKWSPYGACNFTVLDCVRAIEDDGLRLAVRVYGSTNSNQGDQYGPSELHFSNPAPIRSIATEFTVRRTSAMACPPNTTLFSSHAHTILQGTFFNSGSGNSADDVQGLLFFDHDVSSSKGVLDVIGLMSRQGQFFGGVGLGTINVGQKVIAQLSWDQPNHQFVASWTDVLTNTKTEALMPYTMPDTAPATGPDKLIGVRTWVPNCIGTQMLVTGMDTTVDKVWIGE